MQDKENNLYKKAFAFAVRIVKLGQYLIGEKKEYVISKQVMKSGTSICANIAEANGSISGQDFTARLAVALKEAHETKFWIELLHATDYITEPQSKSLYNNADELCRILYAIIGKKRIFDKENKRQIPK
ncbi:MAG: four helix bundle protein [Ignavibacteriaceae bacterium]|nr:four helix bundle protein [Ignavibacteriaceae bacterium]